jgi:hypothetical protein
VGAKSTVGIRNFNLQAMNILGFSKKVGTTIRSGQPQLLKVVENLGTRTEIMWKIK